MFNICYKSHAAIMRLNYFQGLMKLKTLSILCLLDMVQKSTWKELLRGKEVSFDGKMHNWGIVSGYHKVWHGAEV